MRHRKKAIAAAIATLALAAGCGGESNEDKAEDEVKKAAEDRTPYIPKNDVEFDNYVAAQKLYDSPATVIWCTAFPEAPTQAPITVPVAGKLTSSSTTFFNPESRNSDGVLPARSVDGLYHPNPPQYRFGFTPGGEYVDFFNLATICTTKPLAYERQEIAVKVDPALAQADAAAEAALEKGDQQAAGDAIAEVAP